MKKTIIGLFAALFFVSIAGCKINVGSSGGQQGGSVPTGNFKQTGYIKTGTQNINGTNYDLVTFGNFPQSEKDSNVTVSTTATNVNGFTCYKGDDDEWYVNFGSKYYKVEPIKWRVLTTNYDHDGNASTPGKKLLLAENILINKPYDYYASDSYADSPIRNYLTDDFFTTAFTQAEQAAIATTTVVNNAERTNPDSNATLWNDGDNSWACDPTEDKIFLLSEQEATKADYGFAAYDASGIGNTRIRMTTAFAKANGAFQSSTAGYGGSWWLRSCDDSISARIVDINGNASICGTKDFGYRGVVPALCLE
ncbi:MAG: hypothetical protein J6T20_07355 [Treponema sp.]|nr:hypothetical protein [Treponema sp.]